MKFPIAMFAAAATLSLSTGSASAASFDCMDVDDLNAAERRVCQSRWLGSLDERLDSWYRRALERARYFDQTDELRGAQRNWLLSRNACGAGFWCLRQRYVERIGALKRYVEHV